MPHSFRVRVYLIISRVPSSPQSLILCFSLSTLSCMFLSDQSRNLSTGRVPSYGLGRACHDPQPPPRLLHSKGRAKSKRALVTPTTRLPRSGPFLLCPVFHRPPCFLRISNAPSLPRLLLLHILPSLLLLSLVSVPLASVSCGFREAAVLRSCPLRLLVA